MNNFANELRSEYNDIQHSTYTNKNLDTSNNIIKPAFNNYLTNTNCNNYSMYLNKSCYKKTLDKTCNNSYISNISNITSNSNISKTSNYYNIDNEEERIKLFDWINTIKESNCLLLNNIKDLYNGKVVLELFKYIIEHYCCWESKTSHKLNNKLINNIKCVLTVKDSLNFTIKNKNLIECIDLINLLSNSFNFNILIKLNNIQSNNNNNYKKLSRSFLKLIVKIKTFIETNNCRYNEANKYVLRLNPLHVNNICIKTKTKNNNLKVNKDTRLNKFKEIYYNSSRSNDFNYNNHTANSLLRVVENSNQSDKCNSKSITNKDNYFKIKDYKTKSTKFIKHNCFINNIKLNNKDKLYKNELSNKSISTISRNVNDEYYDNKENIAINNNNNNNNNNNSNIKNNHYTKIINNNKFLKKVKKNNNNNYIYNKNEKANFKFYLGETQIFKNLSINNIETNNEYSNNAINEDNSLLNNIKVFKFNKSTFPIVDIGINTINNGISNFIYQYYCRNKHIIYINNKKINKTENENKLINENNINKGNASITKNINNSNINKYHINSNISSPKELKNFSNTKELLSSKPIYNLKKESFINKINKLLVVKFNEDIKKLGYNEEVEYNEIPLFISSGVLLADIINYLEPVNN